ncbi:DinB family protein [Microlunatus soli]|uniref:Uncharacterized damage-inducible protein DinB (Forms a four-helix bundle) n=1 Tax=Microlunatus soli TaxID=630515 RepID=A0A1H2AED7_9ACTN|nr:DinB family protein [Microlunatus soli]SDT44365.1 Uncharacterized damage-inducible protein DinB (forms a four-helix bundle) [Microlunatus soli]
MQNDQRLRPASSADERAMITGWLDWQRQTVPLKCAGLTDEQARRRLLPTSPEMTVGGLVSHLIAVERHWLVGSFLGEPAGPLDDDGWVDDEPLDSLVDRYLRQCEVSRRIVAAHQLDELERYAPEGMPVLSLRWILQHLIEETARHLGHLDILAELLDGRRGA